MEKIVHTNKLKWIGEQWAVLFFVIMVLSIITGIINPKYFSARNMINIFEQISVLGLVAAGATILIVSGNFDISVGANIGLSACVMAMLMKTDMAPFPSVMIGLLVAVTASLFIGGCSIAFNAPSFIISMASVGIFKGIALAMTEGTIQTIYGKFEAIGATRLFGFIPLLFIISLIGYIFIHFILAYTRLGRRVYAIGSNSQAAYLAGINVKINTMFFFALSGLMVGIASMLLLSRVGAVQPSTGSGIELRAIGAVVIGGAPMNGGKGKIIGTFFGVLLMGVISNVLNMLNVNPYFQDIVFGVLVISALAISMFTTLKKAN